jgi:hypothetical protein
VEEVTISFKLSDSQRTAWLAYARQECQLDARERASTQAGNPDEAARYALEAYELRIKDKHPLYLDVITTARLLAEHRHITLPDWPEATYEVTPGDGTARVTWERPDAYTHNE